MSALATAVHHFSFLELMCYWLWSWIRDAKVTAQLSPHALSVVHMPRESSLAGFVGENCLSYIRSIFSQYGKLFTCTRNAVFVSNACRENTIFRCESILLRECFGNVSRVLHA